MKQEKTRLWFLSRKHDEGFLDFLGKIDKATRCAQVFNLLLSKVAVALQSPLLPNST